MQASCSLSRLLNTSSGIPSIALKMKTQLPDMVHNTVCCLGSHLSPVPQPYSQRLPYSVPSASHGFCLPQGHGLRYPCSLEFLPVSSKLSLLIVQISAQVSLMAWVG